MMGLFDLYLTRCKIALMETFQYRAFFIIWMLGMFVEPIIYLVVWTTIADSQGGSVGGYTAGDFAAYYIVWTWVRQMNVVVTPLQFERHVREGTLSPMLLRPANPIHFDLGWFISSKVITFFLWIPIAIILVLLFHPTLNPTLWQVSAFAVAIVTGFLVRFIVGWNLGLVSFWTTRIIALLELWTTVELFFSGRLVPLALLPDWAQQISYLLPFRWSFAFPIELVLGRLSPQEVLGGFFAQALWFVFAVALINVLWRVGVRRYSAVGA